MAVNRPTILKCQRIRDDRQLDALLSSTKAYYDAFASGYVEFYKNWKSARDVFADADYKKGYDRVAEILTDIARPGHTLLDLGCGVGVWSTLLAENGSQVVALDSSLNCLRTCRQRATEIRIGSRVSLVLADGFSLPFRVQTFDGATLNWVLAHIPVQSSFEFLTGVGNVVKKNGWLVISDSYWRGQKGGKEQIQVRDTDEGTYEVYKYYYEPTELQDLIERAFGSIDLLENTDYELICVAKKE